MTQWHELDIADHMPSDQCVMVLMTKMEALPKTQQVGERWSVSLLNLIYLIAKNLHLFLQINLQPIGQFLKTLLDKTHCLQSW